MLRSIMKSQHQNKPFIGLPIAPIVILVIFSVFCPAVQNSFDGIYADIQKQFSSFGQAYLRFTPMSFTGYYSIKPEDTLGQLTATKQTAEE